MSQGAERRIPHQAAVVEDPLELGYCRTALPEAQIGQPTHIGGVQPSAQFVGASCLQKFDCLRCIATVEFHLRPNGRQPATLNHRV